MRILILACAVLALSPVAAVLADETPDATTEVFHEPFQLTADGKPIAVEAPGFACPTFVDVDGDGKRDMVVGQFKQGKMHVFKNIGTNKEPAFGKGDWIKTGDKPALVPDVW